MTVSQIKPPWRCGSCRYWASEPESPIQDQRQCFNDKIGYSIVHLNDSDVETLTNYLTIDAHDSATGAVWTGPEFGCIHWKEGHHGTETT